MNRRPFVFVLIALGTAALVLGPLLDLWGGAWNLLPAVLLAGIVIGAVVAEDHLMNVVAVLALVFGALIATLAQGVTPLLGLDLKGGFSVVLEAPEGTDQDVLDVAVEIMRDRIEALGNVQEPEIAVAGENSIVVQLPGVTDRDRALAAVGTTGSLEFRPVLDVSPVQGVSPLVTEAIDAANAATTTTTLAVIGSEDDESTTTTTAPPDETTTTTVPQPQIVLPIGIEFCDPEVADEDELGCVVEETGFTQLLDPDLEAWVIDPDRGIAYHVGPAEVRGSDIAGAEALFQQTGGGGGPLGVGGGGTGSWVVPVSYTHLRAHET